ncbi:MAG: hypothetical protein ACTSU3_05190 [Candidatus Thorarchaeota archaeon]
MEVVEESIIALNWTTGAYVDLLSVSIITIQLIVMGYYYSKEKHRHVVFLLGVYVSLTITASLRFIATLYLIPIVMIVGYYLIPVIGVFTCLLADSFTRDSVDPKKMLILGILTTIVAMISFEPDAVIVGVYSSGEPGVILSTRFTLSIGIITIMICSVFAYYTPLMHRAASAALKRYTRLCMLSGFLFVVVVPLSLLVRASNILPRVETLLTVLAIVPWTIALVKEPRLAFVLPFKVIRLIVFETEGGIPIYNNTWEGKDSHSMADESLFAGMLQGIGMILNEAMDKGDVREIKMADATLLLHHGDKFPIACVLVTTASTQTLRHALNRFATDFYERFADEFHNTSIPLKFRSASELVEEHFAFVPV